MNPRQISLVRCFVLMVASAAVAIANGQDWPSQHPYSLISTYQDAAVTDVPLTTPEDPTDAPSASPNDSADSPSTATGDSRKTVQKEYPRTVHDNGPAGYVRQRYYDESPANPHYRPTTTTESFITEEEANKFITKGSFPKSFQIPGTDTSFAISGHVRLNSFFDFQPVNNDLQYSTSTIPVPQQRGQNFSANANWSRLTLETHTTTERLGDVKTFVQTDFMGNDGTKGVLRLRFAYVDVGRFRFGQAASYFMDYDMWPNLVDPDGPPALILSRRAVMQYRLPITEQLKIGFGLEDPNSSITLPTDISGNPIGSAAQDMPDLTAQIRQDFVHGHWQISGIGRKLVYRRPDETDDDAYCGAVNVAADFHPWAWTQGQHPGERNTASAKSRILGQWATGKGYSNYFENISSGLDGGLNSLGVLEALQSTSWHVGYEHWWSQYWTSNFSYGRIVIDGTDTLPGNTERGTKAVFANLIWVPTDSFWIGLEYIWGERENLDGQSAFAQRLLLGVHKAF